MRRLGHPALNLHSAAHGIDNTRELCQEAVAGVLHDPAPVLGDLWWPSQSFIGRGS